MFLFYQDKERSDKLIKKILARFLQAVPLLLIISFLVFGMIHLAPYDVADSIIKPNMSARTVSALRAKFGLDQPFLTQYFLWLKNFISGDMGHSIINQQDIASALAQRIPNTISLVLPSYITSVILAIWLGLVAGLKRNSWVGKFIDTLTSVGLATPSFWIALLLIFFFGYYLNWFPLFGIGNWNNPLSFLQHLIMPYLTLVFVFFPELSRYVQTKTILEYKKDYVTVQRAFGASEHEILFHHILRNVLLPIVTQIGSAFPLLVTGALITETVFSWPGVGTYLMNASVRLDYPVILAVMFLSAVLVIIGNLFADILYYVVDPRIRK